ncbi:hypothetical protein AGMMS49991_12120 [Spirochaetia bacterium]|nr:hypothetical protein AGMMS49991_12120 [Spirochaetia bacterium]
MKILVDMNLAFRWAEMLSLRGISTVHWNAVGASNAPDSDIVSYAKDKGCAVLTRDLDFGDILSLTKAAAPSVIQIRVGDARPEQLLEVVYNTLISLKDEIEHGALVTIDEHKTRVHILPFGTKK